MADAYTYWRSMLAWRTDTNPKRPMPDFDPRKPETGFYRGQRNEAVAIWWQGDTCLAQVHKPARTGGGLSVANYDRADIIGDSVFSYCCRHPITHEAYKAFVAKGVWPEDVVLAGTKADREPAPRREGSREYFAEDRADAAMAKAIEEAPPNLGESENESGPAKADQSASQPASPEKAFSTETDTIISEAEKYLTSIGRKITEKVHADRLANYAVAAAAVATRAENARKSEKQPILDAGRACDAKWVPIVDRATKVTKNLKTLLIPYFNEVKRKADAEAAEAQKAAEAATIAGEAAPLAGARPSPTTAGTQGRVSLKSQKVYKITDLRAVADFLSKMNAPPQEFIDGVLTSAAKLAKAGVEVPGFEISTEDVAV